MFSLHDLFYYTGVGVCALIGGAAIAASAVACPPVSILYAIGASYGLGRFQTGRAN